MAYLWTEQAVDHDSRNTYQELVGKKTWSESSRSEGVAGGFLSGDGIILQSRDRLREQSGRVRRINTRGENRMLAWISEMKHALRRLSRSPGFVAAAVISIGLGIAANSTIFSMVSKFVLHTAPVGDPATLLALHTTYSNECCNAFSWPLFTDVRDQTKSFSGVASYYELLPASIGGTGEPERVWGQATTANFFDVAQLGMTLGRGFAGDEEHRPVVVLGNRLWKRRFAADPRIAGKTVLLSGRPFTVVGVAPPLFRGIDLVLDCEFWVPLGNLDALQPNTANLTSREFRWVAVIARLKSGVTPAQTSGELNGIGQRLARAYPSTDKDLGFRFEQAGSLQPSRDKSTILLFLGALTVVVLLVLCIACANVANLFLAQASGRQKEMAVRLALGATRGQLLRQMLTESVLLSIGGGLVGVAISLWATQALSAFRIPAPVPLDFGVSVDWKVLLYTFFMSIGAGLLFGLAPAWAVSRPVLSSALKGEDILARPGRRWTLRNVLVVSQISMSLILLCITGLFLRSLQSAASTNVGFRSHGLLMMSVDPRLNGYTPERTAQFLNQLREQVSALPGVSSVAATDVVPLYGGHRSDGFQAEGRPPVDDETSTELYMASPGYFETMGTPLIAGRAFATESPTAPKLAVVNEAFVQRFFKNENPLGQHVNGGGVRYKIIGVAKNIKARTIGENQRMVLYRSVDQTIGSDPSFMGYSLVVQSSVAPGLLAAAVRGEIHSLDPTLAVYNSETIEEHMRSALFLPRLAGTLFGVFGFVGLVLAAVGLYGVMSYSVSRRTKEIGIRLALGAQTGGVQILIIRQGMTLTLIAAALGLCAALAVAKLASSFLYGVQPHDLVTFTIVPVFLGGVALLASWIPARRAARVDPLTALRYE